ncbi:hypothetical protein BH23PSE1_BH23PSE1_06150 [soil metagenome]
MSERPAQETMPDAGLRRIFARTRTIACIGVSTNPVRPSYYVARYLGLRGFRVLPVNPNYAGQTLFGEGVLPDIAAIEAPVDMVDIFRRSAEAGGVVDEALAHLLPLGLATIWMQIGVVDHQAAERARAAGLDVVMNRCPKIEYQRLSGELRMGGFATGIVTSKR